MSQPIEPPTDGKVVPFHTYGEELPKGLVRAIQIPERPIEMMPFGTMGLELSIGDVNLFAAHPGGLKSTLACQIAAEVTQRGIGVLIVTEEDPSKATLPRLRLMGANLEHVIVAKRPLVPQDFSPLIEHEALGFVIADPLPLLLQADQNSNDEVRNYLQWLQDTVLAPHSVTLLGLMHMSKNTQRDTALGRMLGASAFGQLARQVYVLGRGSAEEDDGEMYVDVADEKHSYSARHQTVRYRIRPFPERRGLVGLEEVCIVHRTAAEVLTGKRSHHGDVAAWLIDKLSSSSGLKRSEVVRMACDELELGRSKVQATIKAMLGDPRSPLDHAKDGRAHILFLRGGPSAPT